MDIYLIISFASLIPMIVGVKHWEKGNNLISTGEKSEAVVFKNNFRRTGRDGGMYYPVVRFLTKDKEWITKELSIGQTPAMQEGSKIKVIYDPDIPTEVEIDSTFRLEVLPRIFVAIGIIMFIIGILGYLELVDNPFI
jgi:hypothetical protein